MYSAPNWKELREFMAKYKLTGADVSRIIGTDARTIRRYAAPPEQSGHREMPWAAWMLLRLYAGEVTVEAYRDEVALFSAQTP